MGGWGEHLPCVTCRGEQVHPQTCERGEPPDIGTARMQAGPSRPSAGHSLSHQGHWWCLKARIGGETFTITRTLIRRLAVTMRGPTADVKS